MHENSSKPAGHAWRVKQPLLGLVAIAITGMTTAHAGVLPEDRADVLYHSYDGGGVEVSGPSILVLKKIGESTTVTGNYYVDSISSASIDVVTNASKYAEERTEKSIGVDYLHDDTTVSLGFSNSEENDYSANTANVGISTDMFGGLTTVSLGYALGRDEVSRNGDTAFQPQNVERQHYRLSLTQVVTRDMLLSLSYEGITDQGYLNNPYRTVRYLNADGSVSREGERYPGTHTSNAAAIRSRYYLPYRAAVHGEYRFFTDTWGVQAHTAEIGYTHPLRTQWNVDLKYRYYSQGNADFYNDLFPYADAQNFLARDKELSTFTSQTLGAQLSYTLTPTDWKLIKRGSLNLSYDHILFDYADYRDVRQSGYTPGEEPLYRFAANVIQLYLSIWY